MVCRGKQDTHQEGAQAQGSEVCVPSRGANARAERTGSSRALCLHSRRMEVRAARSRTPGLMRAARRLLKFPGKGPRRIVVPAMHRCSRARALLPHFRRDVTIPTRHDPCAPLSGLKSPAGHRASSAMSRWLCMTRRMLSKSMPPQSPKHHPVQGAAQAVDAQVRGSCWICGAQSSGKTARSKPPFHSRCRLFKEA